MTFLYSMTGRRQHHIRVRLNDQEVARLDEIRGDEERAVYLRRLLHEPPSGNEVATGTEALAILTRLARHDVVSGLLPQPGGFEGLVFVAVVAEVGEAPISRRASLALGDDPIGRQRRGGLDR